MKKIALFIVAAASLAACTKWENKSTEFKVTGVWTGIETQINIAALPFIDSSDVQNTSFMEANFMEDGGLTIDSAGTRMDSLGWAIKNDTILAVSGSMNWTDVRQFNLMFGTQMGSAVRLSRFLHKLF